MRAKRLLVTAGLPGSGKSSVAAGLARVLGVPILSVDPIEAAMWRGGVPRSMTGLAAYEVAEALAEENLGLGLSVIVDAVNPVEAARAMWRGLSERQEASLAFIECVCSDVGVHRQRIEARVRGIAGMPEVTWDRVEERRAEYEPWAENHVTLDTSLEPLDRTIRRVLALLGEG